MYLLFSTMSGKSVKITAECLDIIELGIQENLSTEELLSRLADDEDRAYFSELFRLLFENHILTEQGKLETVGIDSFTIELTYRCNLACKHCSISANTLREPEVLTAEQLQIILERVAELQPQAVVFTGGEPMARAEFFELVEYFHSISDARLGLMTNGTYISENNIDWLVKHFDSFDISLDGVDEETCSLIRGKNVFGKVINSVKLLKSHGCDRVSLSMVDVATNHDRIEDFYKLNEELGTTPMVRAFEPEGRGLENADFLSVDIHEKMTEDEIEKLAEEIGSESRQRRDGYHCGGGTIEFLINAKGERYACAPMDMPEFKLGNALDDNFVESVKSGQFRKTDCFRNMMKCMPYESAECKDCPYVMFCWNCMHEFYKARSNPEYFKNRCRLKKKELRCMWGELV